MKVQNVNRDTLPWKGPFQPVREEDSWERSVNANDDFFQQYTAWIGFLGSTLITLVQGFPVFLNGNWSASNFVASYVGIPIFIVPIIGWKLLKRTKVSRFDIGEHAERQVLMKIIFPVGAGKRSRLVGRQTQRRAAAALWRRSTEVLCAKVFWLAGIVQFGIHELHKQCESSARAFREDGNLCPCANYLQQWHA